MINSSAKMSLWVVRLCLLGQSLVYGFGLLFILRVIPEWGRWYSTSPFYSAQANALLHGDLALSHSLSELNFNLAWSEGGLHQVWGLGIPILRLPLVALAHLYGYDVFPEHVATGLVLSFVAFLVLVSLVEPAITRQQSLLAALPSLGCATLLLLFPPFVMLLQTNFLVYEEALAHAYLYGILEAILLLQFLRKPTKLRWVALMLVAGFGAFVRPPLVFYGFAAWLTGTLAFFWSSKPSTPSLDGNPGDLPPQSHSIVEDQKRGFNLLKAMKFSNLPSWLAARFRVGTWAWGSSLFFLGILTLLLTNWMRFGSPTEFGHKLNFQNESSVGSTYATRFDHPFETEPFPVVLKELVGALFFVKPHSDPNSSYWLTDMFWGQAKAIRMRELSFTTCDWTYLIPLAGAAILVAYWLCRWFRRRLRPEDALLMKMGVWCLLSLIPIFWFYLRTPSVVSRYILDFGPGFVVLIAIGWYAMVSRLRGVWRLAGVFLLGLWMSWEIASARSTTGSPISLSWNNLSSRVEFGMAQSQKKSFRVGSQTTRPGSSGIRFDGTGWDLKSGVVMPLVTVFVEDAQFLELELARAPGAVGDPDPNWVRAKIGLEFLERESVVQEGDIWRIRFKGPRRADYRKNIQPAFIAFVPNTHLADKTTPWILRRVRWRNE